MRRFKKEILRVGKWVHPSAPNGVLEVTKEYLQKLIENFKKTPFVPVLRGHVSNMEAEKNPSLILNKNVAKLEVQDGKLYAEMDIDEKELEKYNDVSVSIDPDYIDKESGVSIGPVLKHVAAVVNPYIKGMEGFTALSDNDKNFIINLSEITEMAKKKDLKKKEVEMEESVEEVKEPETAEETVEAPMDEEKPEAEVSEEAEAKEEVAESADSETEETPEEETAEEEKVEEEAEPEAEESEEEVEASESEKTIKDLEIKLQEANLKLAEKSAEECYNVLLTDGKIVPAMKPAIMKFHEAIKSDIELADGEVVSASTLLSEIFAKAPKLVNLEEADLKEADANDEDNAEAKARAELRELPKHKKESDEEFDKWFEANKATIMADYGEKEE